MVEYTGIDNLMKGYDMFCESCGRHNAEIVVWCPITEEYVCDDCLDIIEMGEYGYIPDD